MCLIADTKWLMEDYFEESINSCICSHRVLYQGLNSTRNPNIAFFKNNYLPYLFAFIFKLYLLPRFSIQYCCHTNIGSIQGLQTDSWIFDELKY